MAAMQYLAPIWLILICIQRAAYKYINFYLRSSSPKNRDFSLRVPPEL